MELFGKAKVAGKLIAAAGLTIGALLLVAALLLSRQTGGAAAKLSDKYGDALGQSLAESVAGDLNQVQNSVDTMATAIATMHEHGLRDRALVLDVTKRNLDASPLVLGSWFFAAPDAWDGRDAEMKGLKDQGANSNGRLEPYWAKTPDGVVLEPPEDDQIFTSDFYGLAAKTGKSAITEPYPYPVNGKTVLMTSITAPVYSGGVLIGVAGMDIALDTISDELGKVRPFGDGRVMLLSGDGKWVAHPDAAHRMKAYDDAKAEQVLAALKEGKPLSLSGVKIDSVSTDRRLVPIELPKSNASWGVLVDAPTATVAAPARNLVVAMSVGGLVVIAAVLLSLWAAAQKIVGGPLGRLTGAVASLSAGRYDQSVTGVEGKDEVGQIARALEQFREKLSEGERMRGEQELLRAEAEAARGRAAEEQRLAAERQAVVVSSLEGALSRLSGGDLTARVHEAFPPEYEQLKRDFNGAMGRLEEAMTTVVGNTSTITAGAGEIAQAADDLSRRTEQQAASLEETAAALDQITATVRRTAQGAEHASAVVAQARTDAERSGQVVANAVAAMGEIETSSSQISQIIGVIDEIAFQTNLLALNAGVEAARAGDAGKGFAVVASEVRALAQRSAEAAREIKDLIGASAGQVGRGVGLVGETGEALQRIVSQITEITAVVGEIAASSKEQASGLAQVNTAVNQMDQVTQQNAAMVEQSTAASHALAREATELAELMGQFRVSSAPANGARGQQARLAAAMGARRAG